ncbi:LysR family transcriptional regulator [Variovorax ginsengisoli]|uniref:DNA-binding transcriptional LysR family regulator n=1 Tax=Variovorax ginsengisoli TaxID=363844 RepID=A0ABT9S6P0_9BURK|nr:LysR family transcriptional regulator [Variovorax ginsengisoli]MDP9900025.1 DNA-binding transcriptional LysR family regulator [Variovorax ginsengisoli]
MELRHLRYFRVVAETGNLSRAAEKLFIAQPPLSTQIRQLEEELGVPLFVRHPKGMQLTAAGQALLPEARFLLDRFARLGDVARDAGEGDGGGISLGFVPSASSTVLPALVRLLRQKRPRLQLELREMISSEQADALVAGHIDAGIARVPARHPRLVVAHQMPDPFCLALPLEGAPAARAVDLQRFAESSFVAFTRHRGPAYFDQSIHLCSQAGFSPRIRYEASTVHGVLELVGAGLGVALVPASTSLLAIEGVVLKGLQRPAPNEVLALLRRKVDANPMLPVLEAAVASIFGGLERRLRPLVASAR